MAALKLNSNIIILNGFGPVGWGNNLRNLCAVQYAKWAEPRWCGRVGLANM